VAARSRAGRSRLRIPAGARDFSLIQTGPGNHHISYSNGTGTFFSPGLKRPAREVDHAPPFSADVKNEWSFLLHPLHGVNEENFKFTLIVL
jgi:hypothetical protein